MRIDLGGRIALVTGAGAGIGRAIAHGLGGCGATVVVTDIDEDAANRTAREMHEQGFAAEAHRLDVTVQDDTEVLCGTLAAAGRRIAILVNNAGWEKVEPFVDSDPADWERSIAVNLLGASRLTRAFLPAMIAAKIGGRIVNISSDAGRVGSPGEAMYSATKAGIVGLSKALARETMRHGITVNCVSPGPADTAFFHALPEKTRSMLLRAIPARRLAAPEEIAAAVLFFASDQAAYVTGQVLSVSGGLTMVD